MQFCLSCTSWDKRSRGSSAGRLSSDLYDGGQTLNQHLPSETRSFHRFITQRVIAVRTFHLGPSIWHYQNHAFKIEWETLHYFVSFVALMIFKIATRQTHARATLFLPFQDFDINRIAILTQRFSLHATKRIPVLILARIKSERRGRQSTNFDFLNTSQAASVVFL